MAKKRSGLFPLLVGAIAGATAIFFSDEKNRAQAKKTLKEVKKNPEAFAKKTAESAQKTAKKMASKAKTAGQKAIKKAKAKSKAGVKKASK
jgi:gas vesicle protein